MNIKECQQVAIQHFIKTGKQLRFMWIGRERKLHCEWLDPENGIFHALGVPGYIDIRSHLLISKKLFDQMKYCELEGGVEGI